MIAKANGSGTQSSIQSLDSALIDLLHSPVGAQIFASLSESEVADTALRLYRQDLHSCAAAARMALQLVHGTDPGDDLVAAHVQHLLWSSWRTAQAEASLGTRPCWTATGTHFLEETRGKPTIFITPLTMPFSDVQVVIDQLIPDRPVAVYGEGLASAQTDAPSPGRPLTIFGDGSPRTMLGIVRILACNGVFCTYPDFVYRGHAEVSRTLFGRPRKLSRAFLSLCSRPGACLLPVLLTRDPGLWHATIYEPVILHDIGSLPRESSEKLLATIVLDMLEGLISTRPEQWLLLSTLVAQVCDELSPAHQFIPEGKVIA
ncbi:lysophospholipid acyltransferase family protein [Granulicella arctica]|uniref:hypothetical protein n=1 Tax=Granulicella arctica TaxID=940613 RepID=UPI0021E0020B|nr:hypothetical protein [Granulicella arctica]